MNAREVKKFETMVEKERIHSNVKLLVSLKKKFSQMNQESCKNGN